MAKDAEANAEADKAKKDLVEARNLLDSAVYQAEKLQKDNGDKISDEDKKTLEEAVEVAKKVVSDEKADKEALENAAKELSDKLMPIGSKMYESAQAETPAEGDDSKDDKKSDEAIEGEVVDPEETPDKADKK
jgi:molecular chaperone DnaK